MARCVGLVRSNQGVLSPLDNILHELLDGAGLEGRVRRGSVQVRMESSLSMGQEKHSLGLNFVFALI